MKNAEKKRRWKWNSNNISYANMSRVNIESIGECESGKYLKAPCSINRSEHTYTHWAQFAWKMERRSILWNTEYGNFRQWINDSQRAKSYVDIYSSDSDECRSRHIFSHKMTATQKFVRAKTTCMHGCKLYGKRWAMCRMCAVKNETSTKFDWILERFVAIIMRAHIRTRLAMGFFFTFGWLL